MSTLFSAHHGPSNLPNLMHEFGRAAAWIHDGPQDHRGWATTSSQETLVEPQANAHTRGRRLTRLSINEPESSAASELEQHAHDLRFFSDIGLLLRSSSSQAHQLPQKTPVEIRDIMEKQGFAVMSYHAALELHVVSGQILSQMSQARDSLFGDGLWLASHLSELDGLQRSAAVNAMNEWDPIYAHHRPAFMKRIASLVEPRILEVCKCQAAH
ncbi:hypothetical protein BKA70DRAFT_1440916 [Coprinopsis sp. MPI-PUGE-AT-0042]|nr:hypothetical protein BKA70DRAFT_1440916 [Coprinopsis sp. MPI-PUGE-AT-0042]